MSTEVPKKRSSKTFKLMEGKQLSNIDTTEAQLEYDAKSPSLNNDSSSTTSSEEDNDDGYVTLDLENSGDLQELEKTFKIMDDALKRQKAKLAAKWDLLGQKKEDSQGDRVKHSLLIDLRHMLERIERIGMVRGKRFEELEQEQNQAIEKLSSIVDLEEEARISRNKAIEIQNETELEMKQIDSQREIIATELKKAEPDLLAARLAVEDISDRALNELISLKKPPSTITNVLTVAVWIVNSVADDNEDSYDNEPEIVSLKGSNSEQIRSPRSARGRTRTVDLTETAKWKTKNEKSPLSPKSPKTPKSGKTPKGAKTPRGFGKSVKGFGKGKRARAHSIGLNDENDSKIVRSKTPSYVGLAPLSESKLLAKQRSKSKNVAKSNTKSKHGKHNKSGSRLDKLKSRNFEKILTQPWQDTRVMLTRGNFKKSVLAFDPKTLDKKVCHRIENEFLKLEDFDVIRATQASKVLGPLVKWIRSLIGYTTIWYKIEPMAKKVTELEMALDIKKLEVKRLKNISVESHKKVIKIRSQMLRMVGYHKIGALYFLS